MSEDDPKTLRSFYCRDALWEAFEQVADAKNVSMDALLNRALEDYIAGGAKPDRDESNQSSGEPRGMEHETFDQVRPTESFERNKSPKKPPPPPSSVQRNNPPKPPKRPQSESKAPPLYLIFNNRRYLINKSKFVIGRGSKRTDLTIRDGNISRTHCAIIAHNGKRYIKDLNSTNGIDYKGKRIESKKIEEGDVFYLCDYAFKFSYEKT